MNKMGLWVLAAAVIVVAGVAGFWLMPGGGAGAWQETGTGGGPAPLPAPQGDDEALIGLARHLGSSDEPTRKAAQELLAQVHYSKRAWLQREADDCFDPDVKAMLVQRLEAIHEQLATHMPPISLHVERATLREVVDALNQEMGTNLTTWEATGDPALPPAYTLDVKGMAFWDVIVALNQQKPFTITAETIPDMPGGGVGYKLRVGASDVGMGSHAISGPLFFYAAARDGGYGMRAREPNDFRIEFVMLCDPRLPVVDLELTGPSVSADSNGNKLDYLTRTFPGNTHPAESGIRVSLSGPRPENWGKTIPSIKAQAHYVTAAPAETLEVPEIESKVGWEGQAAGVTVKLTKMDRHAVEGGYGSMEFAFEVSPEEKRPLVTLSLFTNDNWMAYACNGRRWNPGPIHAMALLVKPTFNGRLEVSVARRVYEYSADFEIKDMPVADKK